MKNWWLPIAVLGLSGLGLLLAGNRSQEQSQRPSNDLSARRDPLGEFGKIIETELDHIQRALEELTESLEADA